MLLLMLAVPSLSGVIANRRLKQSLDSFNQLVRQAQERSVTERRAYLIVWGKSSRPVAAGSFYKRRGRETHGGASPPQGKLD